MSTRHVAAAILLGAAFVFIEYLLMTSVVGTSGVPILDLQLAGWTMDTGMATLRALGPEGVQSYMQIEGTTDLLFPVIYASLFSVLIDATTPVGAGVVHRTAIILPALAATADFFENSAIIALCRHFISSSSISELHIFIAGRVATPCKWTLIFFAVATIVYSWASSACASRPSSPVRHSRAD